MTKEYLERIKDTDKALELALDIRKFEIDLYWKRTAYFWAFIAATFAGYASFMSSGNKDFSVFISCFGIVLSFAWVCVNKGSKYWQENWEAHVDVLEDEKLGALYKTVLSKKDKSSFMSLGASPYSVSKINQAISWYVLIAWNGLLYYGLSPFSSEAAINWGYVVAIGVTIIFCWIIYYPSQTSKPQSKYSIIERETVIEKGD